jgi:DNA-binding NarL/FixJ family response regulator
MINILIADDHAIVRRGVRDILNEMPIAVVVAEACSAQETVKAILTENFDILLLDISFPDGNGLEVLHQVTAAKPNTRVLFLSMYPEEQYARRVLKAGAYGYLTKDSAPTELVLAIQKVIEGGKYVTRSLAERLAEDLGTTSTQALHETLSNREFQVLISLAHGKKISEIANELSLSSKTVSTYRSRILEKLKLKTTAELIRYVMDHGL